MRKENDLNRMCRIALMMALPLGLVACAPDEGEELDETPEATMPEVDRSEAFEPMTVELEGEDIEGTLSEVDGEATITRVEDSLMVSLSLENLPGTGPFQAHIHAGSCDARDEAYEETDEPEPGETVDQDEVAAGEQGRVLVPLEAVTVGGMASTGTPESTPSATTPGTEPEGENHGMSMSTVAISQLQGHEEAFIQVHGEGGQVIACGNIDDLSRATMGAGMGATPTTPSTTPGTEPAPGTNPGGTR